MHFTHSVFSAIKAQSSELSESQSKKGLRYCFILVQFQPFTQRKQTQRKVTWANPGPELRPMSSGLWSEGTTAWCWIDKCTFLPDLSLHLGPTNGVQTREFLKEHNFSFIFLFQFHMPQMETIWCGLWRWGEIHNMRFCSATKQGCQ